MLEFVVGSKVVSDHAHGLRRIARKVKAIEGVQNGVFLDFLRTFRTISDLEWEGSAQKNE